MSTMHPVRLLHPGREDLSVHLREGDDGRVEEITSEGRSLIDRLRLNRPQLVAYHNEIRKLRRLREDLEVALQRARALEDRMNEWDAAITHAMDVLERERWALAANALQP